MAAAARLAALVALAACAATGGGDDLGSAASDIINGVSDAGKDPAVGLVRIYNGNGGQVATCTGALITPLVVLTAAHCADGSLGDIAYSVAFADSYDTKTNKFVGLLGERTVAAKWVNPLFDEKQLETGYDMALLLLESPAPDGIVPLPIDRTRVVEAATPVRMVGFGLTHAGSTETMRIKITAMTQVTGVGARTFDVDGKTSSPCNGDSGGPALVTVGDREVVAGVVSYGDNNCAKSASYTWVAKLLPDVDAFVMGNDPADYGACDADGTCGFGCTGVDPDCPCDADGSCTTACPDADLDPDCPLGCGQNGACVRAGCPTHDPDCLDLADGAKCGSHNDCASDLCVGNGSATVCVPPCGAGGSCPMGATCSKGVNACVTDSGGCSVGGTGGAWLALLFLGLALHQRRHRVTHRRQLP